MKKLFAAIGFLTIIPVPSAVCEKDDMGGLIPYFPLVGLLLGGISYSVCTALLYVFPEAVAAAMMVMFFSGISGAFHLDGLADTFDGFWSSRPRERMLEIMRDSHIGSMGVFAIISLLLIKFSALTAVAATPFPLTCFIVPVTGRCCMTLSILISKYAREDGLAKVFFESTTSSSAVVLLALVMTLIFACGHIAAVLFVVCSAFVYIWRLYCDRKIGGATGDTLGACCELSEALAILTIAALPKLNGLLYA
ncbi:MAG: adenosylcobinamide-GDP ribazoletransferase [Planctomycetes bacterium]|nr:adenosylcobinamide-GDP ribazoletransferase [Planctomycetota bacterium]